MLVGLVDRLAGRLRAARRACRTVVLRLRFSDFGRATRSRTIARATSETGTILATARALLAEATPTIESRGLTLIGVALGNLEDARTLQLELPSSPREPAALDATIDQLRERFGSDAITRAVLLGRDGGPTVPLLPD